MSAQEEARRALIAARAEIDAVDAAMLDLLKRRVDIVERIVGIKQVLDIPALVPERIAEVLQRVSEGAKVRGAPPDLATKLWRVIIDWAVAHETVLMTPESREE